ncbi:hypothetical protein [Allostreptomyces psammosilenae]|uniref:Uncharacterized protein n=1 Tax=Allostreptomyces psammosilenae TaxID=1892865 RepID=A0A852ZSV9_9ACTN|nr:hypothetical protein [Allostreptomyces psammosilenae]NYI04915.1 hypothetical protein [Allostreptomyces psammosilenae]
MNDLHDRLTSVLADDLPTTVAATMPDNPLRTRTHRTGAALTHATARPAFLTELEFGGVPVADGTSSTTTSQATGHLLVAKRAGTR